MLYAVWLYYEWSSEFLFSGSMSVVQGPRMVAGLRPCHAIVTHLAYSAKPSSNHPYLSGTALCSSRAEQSFVPL